MAGVPFIVVPLALGTVVSGNARTATPADHLGEFFYRSMVWRSTGAGNLWVRGDFGTAQPVDFVGMLAANALSGTTIRIRLGDNQAKVDGTADYDSGALAFINPLIVRADGFYHSHHELPALQTRRWWRIDIGGHTGDFEASMLVIGRKAQPARYYETAWQTSTRDLGSITFNRNGVPGVTSGAKLFGMAYKLGWLTEDEAETMIAPLDDAMGKTTPFLTVFDPAPTVYRQRRTSFGWNEEEPSIGKAGYDRFERSYQLLSLFGGGSGTSAPVPPPTFSVAPSIAGTGQVGLTLTGNDGGILNGSMSARQWLLNGSAISGATGATYVPVSGDAGGTVTYRVSATGAGGSATATSAGVTISSGASGGPSLDFTMAANSGLVTLLAA